MRYRARPSFTVEIKRASKRLPSTAQAKSQTRPSLFDWTVAPQSAEPPAPKPRLLSAEDRPEPVASQPSPLRILPDLSLPDPAEVLQREEEERRAVRRREAKTTGRKRSEPVARRRPAKPIIDAPRAPNEIVALPVGRVSEAVPAGGTTQPLPAGSDVEKQQRRKARSRAYQALCRKAKRRNRPLPPLRAGERWKRRLPTVCR